LWYKGRRGGTVVFWLGWCGLALSAPQGPWDPDPSDRAALRLEALDAPGCEEPLSVSVQLDAAHDHYRVSDPARAWGTPYLVNLLEAAARRVRYRHPEADPLLFGDLSWRRGGHLPGHVSHDTGRDADVGLYFHQGRQATPGGFRSVSPRELDAPTTWTLIEALLESDRVDLILLDQRLIQRLTQHLRDDLGWSPEAIAEVFPPPGAPRLWERTGYVRGDAAHHDHLHVRVRCEDGDTGR
jgi:penicillin-insensitive murein endopeptidase